MKRLSTRLLWPVLACVALSPLAAESPDLKDLLRDALYKEEVNRDPEAAAKAYQSVLARNDEERAFAATAQFRLAEVRRKQGRKDDAIAAYRLLLTRYPEAETECKLARENLAGLGAGDAPATGNPTSPQQPPAEGYDESGQKLTPTQILHNRDMRYLAGLQDMAVKSPDKLGVRENFENAISAGYPETLTFLLEKATLGEQIPLLTMAVKSGSLEMVKLVFKGKAPIGEEERKEVLAMAAAMNQLYIAQELLNQGIDINGNPENVFPISAKSNSGDNSPRLLEPALTTAIGYRNSKLVELFLKANPDVNLQATNKQGTPLQAAIQVKDVDLVKELLARGADPNITSSHRNPNGSEWGALDFAIDAEVPELLPLLIKAGGRVNDYYQLLNHSQSPPRTTWKPAVELLLNNGLDAGALPETLDFFVAASPEQAKMMLAHGLKPNQIQRGQSPLSATISTRRFDLAQLLLNEGAKPIEPKQDPGNSGREENLLITAAGAFAPVGLLEDMISKGATLEKDWDEAITSSRRPGIPSAPANGRISAGVRSLFFRHFKLPAMPRSEDVRIVCQNASSTPVAVLQEKSPSSKPSSLEQLLISPANPIQWIVARGKLGPEKITIWRTGADGVRTPLEADMRQDAPFPALEWGDIVELAYRTEDREMFGEEGNAETQDRLPDQATWKMRKRITFPVTVEINGKSRELTMRGDQVIFDPTRKEVPLMGAAQLARIFSGEEPGLYPPATVSVIRSGWPELGVTFQSDPAVDFVLAAGDRVKWEMKGESPSDSKANDVILFSPGLPFSCTFPGDPRRGGPAEKVPNPMQPSLLQALATAYAPEQGKLKSALTSSPEDLDGWLAAGFGGQILSLLPHPDLSQIRIHRKKEGEGESVIVVDLQKAIDALNERTTAAEARAADVLLQPGDRVELPVLAGTAEKAWTGFTPAQTAFLEKALSCTVQYTTSDKGVSVRNVIYHPPHFTGTPGGLVPLPALQGDSSLLVADVLRPGTLRAVSEGVEINSLPAEFTFLSERFQYRWPEQQNIPAPPMPARRPVPANR